MHEYALYRLFTQQVPDPDGGGLRRKSVYNQVAMFYNNNINQACFESMIGRM